MDDLTYIDDFFSTEKDAVEKQAFENRVLHDHVFAEEVAFYLSVNSALRQQVKDEKKKRFRELYQQQQVIALQPKIATKTWKWLAAACIAGLIGLAGWWIIGNDNSNPQQYAREFIDQNMNSLIITMGTAKDSMQTAVNLFNEGKIQDALLQFNEIQQRNPASSKATEYAGIASLRLEKYDDALVHFRRLGSDTSLYSNPGKLYEAITLMKRNNAGDINLAKELLQQIVDDTNNLEGKQEAASLVRENEMIF